MIIIYYFLLLVCNYKQQTLDNCWPLKLVFKLESIEGLNYACQLSNHEGWLSGWGNHLISPPTGQCCPIFHFPIPIRVPRSLTTVRGWGIVSNIQVNCFIFEFLSLPTCSLFRSHICLKIYSCHEFHFQLGSCTVCCCRSETCNGCQATY